MSPRFAMPDDAAFDRLEADIMTAVSHHERVRRRNKGLVIGGAAALVGVAATGAVALALAAAPSLNYQAFCYPTTDYVPWEQASGKSDGLAGLSNGPIQILTTDGGDFSQDSEVLPLDDRVDRAVTNCTFLWANGVFEPDGEISKNGQSVKEYPVPDLYVYQASDANLVVLPGELSKEELVKYELTLPSK